MKFIKSSLAKKLIIILIILMIFNVIIPKEVKAWDFAGILMKPISSLLLSGLISVDVSIGLLLNGLSAPLKLIGGLIDAITGDGGSAVEATNTAIQQLFIGPDSIFSGKVRLLDANIFKATTWSNVLTKDTSNENAVAKAIYDISDNLSNGNDMIKTIRKSIANIYYVLRNICAIIMLAGLIFTGIRILLTANIPSKRTQWLMILQDWLIGMVLLIFSHVIMIGIFYISDTLVDAISISLIGIGGLNASLIKQCLLSFDSAEQIICLVMLGYMIYLTVVFATAYFKRFMWICVLIIFAPVVSIMYAFGQQTKSIYSNWLKEYAMSVLVQPFHLIVYWALVSVPLNMVNSKGDFSFFLDNSFELTYALIAISFIRPAEAYMRQLFGMDKGIARMASYDSGKQTFDAAKNAIEDVVKKIGMVAATAATGGIAAAEVEGVATSGSVSTGIEVADGEPLTSNILGDGKSAIIDGGVGIPKSDPDNLSTDQRIEREEISEEDLTNTQRDLLGTDKQTEAAEKLTEAAEKLTEAAERLQDNVEMIEGNEEDVSEEKMGRFRRILNKPIGTINDMNDIANGDKSVFDLLSKGYDTGLGKMYKAVGRGIKGTAAFQKLENNETYQKAKEKLGEGIDIAKAFEKAGGVKDLYKGFNEIRDTFFATSPSQDWKKSVERMNEKEKERTEQQKFNFTHNDGNIQFIIDKKGYIDKFRAQYPDKTKYSEAYIENLAKEKAKSDLKSLADTYVPMGVTNVEIAYDLDKDRKQYGYTPEEAIKQRASFERFNADEKNTQYINNKYNISTSKVSEAMPNAREYYNNGYNNIVDISKVNALQQKLNASLEMAMKMDGVLKRGGKLNYKGNNAKIKAIFDDLNDNYNK